MMRKKVFYEIKGFDPDYELAFSDVDLCLKVEDEGYLIVWSPDAELYHDKSKIRGHEDTKENMECFGRDREILRQNWDEYFQKGDPYYNPNLTLGREDLMIEIHAREPVPRVLPGLHTA